MKRAEVIMAIREGGWVDRMHTVPKHRRYDLAGHQWNVTMLIWLLFVDDVTFSLLWAGMTHDVPERWVGDTPYPAKYWLAPELGTELAKAETKVAKKLRIDLLEELTDREKNILKICDQLELVLWAREERNMGNVLFDGVYTEGLAALRKFPLFDEVEELVDQMINLPPGSEGTDWWKEMMGLS